MGIKGSIYVNRSSQEDVVTLEEKSERVLIGFLESCNGQAKTPERNECCSCKF